MTSSYLAATPSRLHAKRIIAWWTPFIPQDKPGILTHQRAQKVAGLLQQPDPAQKTIDTFVSGPHAGRIEFAGYHPKYYLLDAQGQIISQGGVRVDERVHVLRNLGVEQIWLIRINLQHNIGRTVRGGVGGLRTYAEAYT